MKLSIAWIFDHIKADWKDREKEIDIQHLISRLSATTAEIEYIDRIETPLAIFTLGRVTQITSTYIMAESAELEKELVLPIRLDVQMGNYYMLKKEQKAYTWATLMDLGSEKEGAIGQIWCSDSDFRGGWKEHFETIDYIITLDNKAVTHRPDMWGHRGFAREIALLLDKALLPEEHFLVSKPIKHYTRKAPVWACNPFVLEISNQNDTNDTCDEVCKRLAGLYIQKIENKASLIPVLTRLARIDSKPINAIVDATNYVMFDIGQPMHAFDANKITTRKIIGRCAYQGEKLQLLDSEVITLTTADYVITDGQKPIALAGIMGGLSTAVSEQTDSLYIESANFDPGAIRKTAARFKKRTEASSRFEKSLDPNCNTIALLRMLKLLDEWNIAYQAADAIASVGPLAQDIVIELSHKLITDKIGLHISQTEVEAILTRLGFGVQVVSQDTMVNNAVKYAVTVPTYRATKDITLAEDIVEEVARFVGYEAIPHQAPTRAMVPFDVAPLMRLRAIKKHMAYGLNMHEVQTYALYDEEFLKKLNYDPEDVLRVANPLSQHWQRLVSSLVPNLLKCVESNYVKQESLRFFEFDRIWFLDKLPVESKELAGIFYEQKKIVDFYEYKALLSTLFSLLGVSLIWVKPSQKLDPWYDPYQTAELLYNDKIIGRAGKINTLFLNTIVPGDAFIFELDGNFLMYIHGVLPVFKSLPKFPEVDLDISLLVPLEVTVAQLQEHIYSADKRIIKVELVDFYSKEEWKDQKSLTFRIVAYDEQRTMAKQDIEYITQAVLSCVKKLGVFIR